MIGGEGRSCPIGFDWGPPRERGGDRRTILQYSTPVRATIRVPESVTWVAAPGSERRNCERRRSEHSGHERRDRNDRERSTRRRPSSAVGVSLSASLARTVNAKGARQRRHRLLPPMEPPNDGPPVSRRAVLGGVAALPAGFGVDPTELDPLQVRTDGRPGPDAVEATVMTRNLGLGVDLSPLYGAGSMAEVRAAAGELLADARNHPFAARMDAVAGEIEAAGPDVVALQEAAHIRTRTRADDVDPTDTADSGGAETGGEATTVVDLRDELTAALSARGLPYEVTASTPTTDVTVPADVDGTATGTATGDAGDADTVDLHLTDREVLLVRSDVATADARGDTFETVVPIPLPGGDGHLTLRRGYCMADVDVRGAAFTVVGTHLESISSGPRRVQAGELLDELPTDRPVVVLGDFNSGPGTATASYDRLTGTLTDAFARRQPGADGFTCCQATGLRNDRSRLDERVDGVLYRGDGRTGAVSARGVRRVGHRATDRVDATVDGESTRVWPSDHAGVVATLAVDAPGLATPSATPTATSAPAPGRSDRATSRGSANAATTRPGRPTVDGRSPGGVPTGSGPGTRSPTGSGASTGNGRPGWRGPAVVVGAVAGAVLGVAGLAMAAISAERED